MDIEVIIRETAVFAGIFGFAVGVFVLTMLAAQQYLQPYIGNKEWLIPAFALLIVTFAIRPIEKLIYNTIGKMLFKKRYEYQKALQDAAAGMSTVRDPKKLLSLIVHIVSMKIKLENVSIMIYDEHTKKYLLRAARGDKKSKYPNASVKDNEPLVEWMKEKKEAIVLDELERWIKDEESRASKRILASDLLRAKNKMEALDASVCVPSFYRGKLLGILVLGNKKSGDFFSQDDLALFSALADEAAIAFKNSQLYTEIEHRHQEIEALYQREHRLFMHASVAFAAAIDARDAHTHGHSERVTNYSMAILEYMSSAPEAENNPVFRQWLQISAVLHDIGKIAVSDDILHKPASLDDREWEQMRKHPVVGAEIVSHIKGLRNLVPGIRHHHERYDGKGYPDGLKSENIPLIARIIAIADTYDAITSNRPYRKGMSAEAAKEEVKNNGSTQFDPYIVAAFLKAFEMGALKASPPNGSKANTAYIKA